MNFTADTMTLGEVDERTEVELELIQLARNVRAYQDSRKPRVSDEEMLRRYPALGSTKTYRRLRDGDPAGLVPHNFIAGYRSVWAHIESVSGANAAEEIYDDLLPASTCRLAAAGLIVQRGTTRLMVIEGPSGAAKTTSLRIIAQRYPADAVMLEASESWASLTEALGDILVALDDVVSRDDLPASKGKRLAMVVESLRRKRRVILIDEGHHCTGVVLNAIKTILNKTSSLIVIACIDTLWRKLTTRNYAEAVQLIHNRLYERIVLAPPSADQVILFLTRRVPTLTGDLKQAAAYVSNKSATLGHYAFLRRIAEKLTQLNEAPDGTTVISVANALETALSARQTRTR